MRYIHSIIVESYDIHSPFKESLDALLQKNAIVAVHGTVMALSEDDTRKPVVWMVEE